MVGKNLEQIKSKRKQALDERIREINNKLPAMVKDIRKQIVATRDPRPGMVFFATAPPAEGKGDEELSPSVMLLRREGHGLWICCKISMETSVLGPFDLLLDPDEWSGGFPILLESWNTVSLHEDDMDGKFFDDVIGDVVKKAEELYCAYQQSGAIPVHLQQETGRMLPEGDSRWQFRNKEMMTMERVRLHYHEGWKGLLNRATEKVRKFIKNLTIPLVPVPSYAATKAVCHFDTEFKQNTPLLEDDLLSVVVTQERDLVSLRIYPENPAFEPESILVDNEAVTVEKRGPCFEASLGLTSLLPAEVDIELLCQAGEYHFHISFTKIEAQS